MPTKKNEAVEPLALHAHAALERSHGSFDLIQPTNKEEQHILDTGHTQQVVIRAQAEKTITGLNKLNDVHAHKTELFSQATQVYGKALREAQGEPMELYVAEYIKHDAHGLAEQGDALVQVCAASIATQIAAPVQIEQKPKRGLLERLRGDD